MFLSHSSEPQLPNYFRCQGRPLIYGHARDKSPSIPRLMATPSKRHITFVANAACVDSQGMDLRVMLGSGATVGQHSRLGRESQLRV